MKIMDAHQKAINKKMLKVNILADIIEAEIKGINPVVNINNHSVMLKMSSLEGSCMRFRKIFDSVNYEIALKLGDISDMIDLQIEKILE